MSYYTYILLCQNGRYYVGHTNNLKNRFNYHLKKWGSRFTSQNKPIKILWHQKFGNDVDSIKREKQIKGWTRKKKENLIKGVWK